MLTAARSALASIRAHHQQFLTALYKAVRDLAQQPAMIEALQSQGALTPEAQLTAQFTAMMSERLVAYDELVKRLGIRSE